MRISSISKFNNYSQFANSNASFSANNIQPKPSSAGWTKQEAEVAKDAGLCLALMSLLFKNTKNPTKTNKILTYTTAAVGLGAFATGCVKTWKISKETQD